jgi:hypothetical protein
MAGSFAANFRNAMIQKGWSRHGAGVVTQSKAIACFIHAQVFRRSPGIVFGLWFFELQPPPIPAKHERFHYYQGVDRFLDIDLSVKTAAYMKSDSELETQVELALSKAPEIAVRMQEFTNLESVLLAYRKGKLAGLLRWEARDFLDSRLKGRE